MKIPANMRLIIVLGLIILIVPEVLSMTPKKHYFHFAGKINDKGYIEMNLVKINDSIYGNYSLVSKTGNSDKFTGSDDYGPVQLCGKVNAKGVYIIKENPWDKGAVFTGKMVDDQTLKGTWESADGSIKSAFELIEKYTEGSLPFSVYFERGSASLVNKPKSPKATMQYCFLSPTESTDPHVYDSLTMLIQGKFLGKPVRKISSDKLLSAMKEVYFDNYITTNESIYREIAGASFNWVSLKFMDILLNRSQLLTFYIEQYAFTGGAHGLQTRDFTVINLKTGRPVSLSEIFSGNYENALTDIITSKIRRMHNIDADKKLTDNGFFVESVKPTSNFYVTVNGIGFFYNHYEIAPYSDGPDDVFITFPELRTLLTSNSILRGLPGYLKQP
jgi:hypothetical protein